MSMFGKFDKDLKQAGGCLHKAADMFFHPIGEDIFHNWDHGHPAFPGPTLTKVKLECKVPEKKEEKKKEEVKVAVKVEEKCCKEEAKVVVKVEEKCCKEEVKCGGCKCHCCCTTVVSCCCPPPPPPPPPPPSCFRVYPCYKVLDKVACTESEWSPMMKDYTADKVWQLHVYLPDVPKDKVFVDVCEGHLYVHGEGVFHTHCGMWPGHVEHCCDCTRKEPTMFCKKFKLPGNAKARDAHVEFEKEVLVVRIMRG